MFRVFVPDCCWKITRVSATFHSLFIRPAVRCNSSRPSANEFSSRHRRTLLITRYQSADTRRLSPTHSRARRQHHTSIPAYQQRHKNNTTMAQQQGGDLGGTFSKLNINAMEFVPSFRPRTAAAQPAADEEQSSPPSVVDAAPPSTPPQAAEAATSQSDNTTPAVGNSPAKSPTSQPDIAIAAAEAANASPVHKASTPDVATALATDLADDSEPAAVAVLLADKSPGE